MFQIILQAMPCYIVLMPSGDNLRKKIFFILVGGMNTLFGYGVYSLFVAFGLHSQFSLAIATVSGVIFNYLSYGRIVFDGVRGKAVFIRFVLTYVVVYLTNAIILDRIQAVLDGNPFLAQFLCIPFAVALGWILMNRWVFRE